MTATVMVECDELIHGPGGYLILTFARGGAGWTTQYQPELRGANAATGVLIVDEYLGGEDRRHPSLAKREGLRLRFALRCECGMNVTVRAEKLNPILDVLAAAGISSITLSALAARL